MKKLICIISLIGVISPNLSLNFLSKTTETKIQNQKEILTKKSLSYDKTWYDCEKESVSYAIEINMTANGIHDYSYLKNYSRIGIDDLRINFYYDEVHPNVTHDTIVKNDWWTTNNIPWGGTGWIWQTEQTTQHNVQCDFWWQTVAYEGQNGEFWLSLQYKASGFMAMERYGYYTPIDMSFSGLWIE